MARPVVTIVVPSFNQGQFLRRAINSILAQDYPHVECIVIDGKSSDDSVAVLESYGNRISWISEKDRNQTHALNKGFARATGQIHGFLCADDLLLPGAISSAVHYLGSHPFWDLVYGNGHLIDEDDRVLGVYPSEPFSHARLRECCFICQPAAFWRANLARKIGPFNEELTNSMDYEFWFRAHRAGGRLVFVDDFFAQSRCHGGSKTEFMKLDIYRRNIQICLEQDGSAELNHFVRLWRHQCWEQPQGWPGRLRWLPFFCSGAALGHYVWAHRHPRAYVDLVSGIGRGLKRLVGNCRRRLFGQPMGGGI